MINWQNVKLGEIVKLQQGFALNKKSNHYLSYEKNGIPLLKISDLLNDTQSLFVKNNIPKQFIANENDIIYSIFSSSIDDLNVDYSEFRNHSFFGSAEYKLKNFYKKKINMLI